MQHQDAGERLYDGSIYRLIGDTTEGFVEIDRVKDCCELMTTGVFILTDHSLDGQKL